MRSRYALPLLILSSSCLSHTSAELICVSPSASSLPTTGLQPGAPIPLKFRNKSTTLGSSASLSDVSANLICTSTGESVLILASRPEASKVTSASISQAQATSALESCPSNSFHIQYEESSLLSKNVKSCGESFPIHLAANKASSGTDQEIAPAPKLVPEITLPIPTGSSPSVSVPIPEVSSTATVATGSSSTSIESQPTTTTTTPAPVVPTTTTTAPAVVTTTTTTPKAPHQPSPSSATTTRPSKSGGSGNHGGGNGKGQTLPQSTSAESPSASNNNNGSVTSSDSLQQSSGSGPSTSTIAGISVGIIAAVGVILGAMFVWRKRSQRRADFDLFYSDSLAAASGHSGNDFSNSHSHSQTSSSEQPIYGRSAPSEIDEQHASSSNALPRPSRSHTSKHSSSKSPLPPAPPPLIPMHPLPTAGQDASYYQQQQDPTQGYYGNQEYYDNAPPPQRNPSYRLPHHHPALDYEYPYGQQ